MTHLTPLTLRLAMEACGMSGHELARRANVSEGTVRHWLSGRYPVPCAVAAWLDDLSSDVADLTEQIEALTAARQALVIARPCPPAKA